MDHAAEGDASAYEELLAKYHERLCRMVYFRMDPLLQARIDPADVVQEALIVAARKLPDYLQKRPIPFYPWLRRIAWEQLIHAQERHLVGPETHRVERNQPRVAPVGCIPRRAGRIVGRPVHSQLGS